MKKLALLAILAVFATSCSCKFDLYTGFDCDINKKNLESEHGN